MCKEHVIRVSYEGSEEKYKAWGRGNDSLQTEFKRIMDGVRFLRDKKGIASILLAHAKVCPFNNPLGEDYDRYQAKLPDSKNTSLNKVVTELSDVVLFANHDTIKDVTAVSAPVMYTKHTQAWDAKNRHGMPLKLPLKYEALEQYINPKKETETK